MRKEWCTWALMGVLLLTLTNCSTSSRSSRDYTVNRSHKKRSNSGSTKSRTYRSSTTKKTKSNTRIASKNTKRDKPSGTMVREELMERNRIVDFARKFKGRKYQYGGKTPESGFDCSGLVYYTFRHFNYGMVAGSANQAKLGRRISIKEAVPGDLLFFGNNQRVSHVGIVSFHDGNELRMVHSSSSRGVVEEDILSSTYWKSRFLYARNVVSNLDSAGNARK